MKKNLGKTQGLFPMPVLIISAYDENGVPNSMNAAWGTMCDMDKVLLILSEGHKTTKNIMKKGAFTVAVADREHIKEADYFGLVSGNNIEDKFKNSHLLATKSKYVDAPVIEEFKISMECKFVELVDTEHVYAIVGEIVNVTADEEVLDENGKIDAEKLNAIMFDPFKNTYLVAGDRVGKAWSEVKSLIE